MRRGFTLIELLVVVTIIAILVSLGLAAAGPLRNMARRNATTTVLQAVQQAVMTLAADQGKTVEPSEHPLAASAEPRAAFVRAGGGAVATAGEALLGVELARLTAPADQQRLLLDDDRCSDAAMPHLYGMARADLRILGAGLAEVTRYRLLPHGTAPIDDASLAGKIVDPAADADDATEIVTSVLGKSGSQGELARLGALWAPPDDIAANRLHHGRVYRTPVGVAGTVAVAGERYRLRGTGVYDAWGNEILCRISAKDTFLFTSAGRDGHFRFRPGAGGFATPAQADAVVGPDADAAVDNLVVGR